MLCYPLVGNESFYFFGHQIERKVNKLHSMVTTCDSLWLIFNDLILLFAYVSEWQREKGLRPYQQLWVKVYPHQLYSYYTLFFLFITFFEKDFNERRDGESEKFYKWKKFIK